MAIVYSTRIWQTTLTVTTAVTGPVCPAGFVWVIREVIVFPRKFSEYEGFAGGFLLSVTGGFNIAGWQGWDSRMRKMHRWEGRTVVNTGQGLFAITGTFPTDLTVSGYQLTLP